VKEKLCYIALDYDTVLTSTTESSDNDTTNVKQQYCPDMLFQPSFIGEEASGFRDTF